MQITRKLCKAKFDNILYILLLTIILSQASFSQTKGEIEKKFKDKAVKALISDMNSSNRGVAQSAIYLAGFYKYAWTVDPLINILDDTLRETDTRILAAYSLFMIGDEKGLLAIRTASISSGNYMVQGTCDFIFNDYDNKYNRPVLFQRK